LGVGNGWELGEGGDFEAQMFSLAQKLVESTNVQPNTKAPLLPPRSSTVSKPMQVVGYFFI